jgi:hypothetical protein
MPEALLVILKSDNGRDNWTPVKPEDVPEWVRAQDNMARLVQGDMCMDPTEGEKGSAWYRAEKVESTGETRQ